jgi:hypothetical protein
LERTFAKSIQVKNGQVCYPEGNVPLDGLEAYGTFAVLSTRDAITAAGTALHMIGGTPTTLTASGRIGGSIALSLSGATAGAAAGAVAGTVSMLWPNNFANDSAFYKEEDFAALSFANIGVRVNAKHLPEASIDVFGVYTGGNKAWGQVPVIAASARGDQLVADLGDGIELVWTPAVDRSRFLGIPALEGTPELLSGNVYVFAETEQAERAHQHPAHPPDFRDAIIWFPSHSGFSPVYIALNLRGAPGIATGLGQNVPGTWLAGANIGSGAPIPTRIADKLRGREFASFDSFRKAFWKAVAEDSELGREFNSSNLASLVKGMAPIVPRGWKAGKRKSFELHHVEMIKSGGAVYDIDNLKIVTPKRHIDIHREEL